VRILLDENLDWRLEHFLRGHEVKSVPRIGWAGLKNSRLLARAPQSPGRHQPAHAQSARVAADVETGKSAKGFGMSAYVPHPPH
jgi:hypothetical protein